MNPNWNLDKLYTGFDDPLFLVDHQAMPTAMQALIDFCQTAFEDVTDDHTGEAVPKLERFINLYNDFSRYYNLIMYASLIIEVNNEHAPALKIINQIEDILTDMTQVDTLLKLYLATLSDLEAAISASPLLTAHAFMLREAKKEASHILTPAEEMVFAKMKLTGSNGWASMYGQVVSTLGVPINLNGETQHLTLSQVRNLAEDKEQYIRKTAYYAELAAYPQIEKAIASALNNIKGEAIATAKLRGYENVLDMTLSTSFMDHETLEALMAAMEETMPMWRDYFTHKAHLLGHNTGKLPWYDLFSPVGTVDMQFTKEEAAAFVSQNFAAFGEDLGNFVNHAFDNDWVDWYPAQGKSGGAFCMNLHSIQESRVLMNFSGSFGDVLTLAHEFGHAYHGEALKDVTFLNSSYSMPIAEVASTFCETLVINAALKTATPAEQLVIMENNLQGSSQVIVDIYSRYLFESRLIKLREAGSLSVDELKDIMGEAQRAAYGDALSSDHPYMWLCKGHYYGVDNNFYNYPYAYGLLFAKGLYSLYQKEGASFAARYRDMLTATGANNLYDVGQIMGINVRDKGFWREALAVCEAEIKAFVTLPAH